jgi:GT2 family glycosyltransferase
VGVDGCLEYLSVNRVYIIIVNWNGGQETVECLDSLLLLSYPSFTLVVCDNGSSDDSLEVIKRWAESHALCYYEISSVEASYDCKRKADFPLVIIRSSVNLGFAGGNNVGMRYALARGDCDYVWLLNNDTVVDTDALTRLVERMEQQPSVGMCGSTIRLYHDPDKIQALGGAYYCRWIGLPWHYGRFRMWGTKINQRRAEMWMNYVEGASMLVSRKFVEEIGLMCEDYFLYFEEADWAVRAKGRFQLAYAQESVVYHKVGASIGTSSNPAKKSYICDYFNIRNRILFTRRYYPLALPIIYLVLLGSLLLRLFLGKWDRVRMISKLLFGYNDAQYEIMTGCRTQA